MFQGCFLRTLPQHMSVMYVTRNTPYDIQYTY